MPVVRSVLKALLQTAVRVRPVQPDDRPELQRFFGSLGQRTLDLRFHCAFNGLSPQRIEQLIEQALTQGHQVQMWVATVGRGTRQQIVAQGGFMMPGSSARQAEFALLVADSHQGQGIGTRLLQAMRQGACTQGVLALKATVRNDNLAMRALLSRCDESGARISRPAGRRQPQPELRQDSSRPEPQPSARSGTVFETELDTAPGWRFRQLWPTAAALCWLLCPLPKPLVGRTALRRVS